MPTLVRLLTIVAVIAAVVYAIMAALIFFVEPTRREVIVDVPLPQLEGPPAAGGTAPTANGGEAAAGSAQPAAAQARPAAGTTP